MSFFKKEILHYEKFYIAKFTKNPDEDYLIFIHGGPGYNCGVIEYLIEHNHLFNMLNYNIILYDQRSCGRSSNRKENILHENNVDDLNDICEYLEANNKIKINGLIGHSYGAKLLFDYCKKFDNKNPSIFIATAHSIFIPRLNNLIFDLAYLKKTSPIKYKKVLLEMDDLTTNKIWQITEELSPLFYENKDRDYIYWANMDAYKKVQRIKDIIKLPVNEETFMSVRKDLYSNKINFSVDIESLNTPYLWINGFHDFIMNGSESVLSNKKEITTFYKSSHYPHIEENERLSELINDFIKNIK